MIFLTSFLSSHRARAICASFLCLFAVKKSHADVSIGAASWMEYGKIGHSSDTGFSPQSKTGDKVTGRSLQGYGSLISLKSSLTEKLVAQVGLGVGAGHFIIGRLDKGGGYSPMNIGPFVSEADLNYSFWNAENSKLKLKLGYFSFNYNPDVTNMGLYLLRGPVYPGVVVSGFDMKPSSILGFNLEHQTGAFKQNLILNSETELNPYFDLSLAYIAGYKIGKAFRIGAGVNFYHIIPIDKALTSHHATDWETTGPISNQFDRTWIWVDSVAKDTTYLSFQGTKVGLNLTLDIKELLGGVSSMGEEDLKLYSEVAIVGLEMSKAYKSLYGSYVNRMPIMVGFNIPAFQFLDKISLEVEYYQAKFRDDLMRLQHSTAINQSPIPNIWGTDKEPNNITSDDFKWSLYIDKTLQKHVKLTVQVANDHVRPGIFQGLGDNNPPRQEAVLFTSKDWYWMSKVSVFF